MSDNALLQEIRDRRTAAEQEWGPVQEESKKDKLCVAGKPWQAMDPDGYDQRFKAKRPALALDELGQYINQTVNDVRANPRGLKFAPTGDGADDKTAEFYENHTREIEYRSNAAVAYSTAFENAVTSGVGWIRITTRREHPRTFNKEIWIDPIVNPDQVICDPDATWPDSRDMSYLLYLEPWHEKEFAREFKGAKFSSFSSEQRRAVPGWLKSGTVDVAEYWKIEKYTRRLLAFRRKGAQPGQEEFAFKDELPGKRLPAGAEVLREEDVEDTRVYSCLTNGLEILRENKWQGRHIPFVSCLGKVIYVDEGEGSRRKILSMTRLAREPYMLYCYYRTCEAELVGMTPKFPYFAYEDQLAPDQVTLLQKSLHEPVALIRVKATVEGAPPNTILGFPQRQPYEPPIQGLEMGAEAARRAIQAAMGISPLPTPAQRDNQKSGKALERIEASGQKGSFHFVDHYDLMIQRGGVIMEDLITPTLDTMRDVPVRKADGTADVIRINDPNNEESVSTKAEHRVTISTGPATESQRQEGADFVNALVSNIQAIAAMAGPQRALQLFAKSVKLKQLGPIGDEIIELLDPPQMGQDGKPLPPHVAQMLAENQQLKQLLQQASQEKNAKVVEQQGKFAITVMQEDREDARNRENNETKLSVAELGAKVDRLTLFLEERDRLGVQMQATMDRVHEALEATKERAHAVNMANVGHQQQLEAGDQAHGNAVDMAQTQASLQPPADGAEA
jgi:hypothetical protein